MIIQVQGACDLHCMLMTIHMYNYYDYRLLATPCAVATKLLGIQKTDFLITSPCNYVQNAFATIGIQSRSFGTISHALQVSV